MDRLLGPPARPAAGSHGACTCWAQPVVRRGLSQAGPWVPRGYGAEATAGLVARPWPCCSHFLFLKKTWKGSSSATSHF